MPLDFLIGAPLLTAVIAYLLGCSNGAVIISKYILRDDVRTHGSGNAGLTNFYRTFGGPLTLAVILIDVLKAVAAVLISIWISRNLWDGAWASEGDVYAEYWGALFCLLGHMFPCMFRFKGGKGILSGGIVAFMIDWRVALVVWGGFLVLAVLTKYVSLGSVWAGGSFPFITWYCYPKYPAVIVLAFIIGGLILWQHRANIKRLLTGTENKFSLHKKKS